MARFVADDVVDPLRVYLPRPRGSGGLTDQFADQRGVDVLERRPFRSSQRLVRAQHRRRPVRLCGEAVQSLRGRLTAYDWRVARYEIVAVCDSCGAKFPSGIHELQAFWAEAPVDPRCPQCGSTGRIPETFDTIKILDSLTDDERATLTEIVKRQPGNVPMSSGTAPGRRREDGSRSAAPDGAAPGRVGADPLRPLVGARRLIDWWPTLQFNAAFSADYPSENALRATASASASRLTTRRSPRRSYEAPHSVLRENRRTKARILRPAVPTRSSRCQARGSAIRSVRWM